jgi:multiple sugar transport system ATP-binding protein
MASLSLQKLEKSYAGTQVLHGIDLDVRDGEFVVFVGPSGCGKSTLLRCIAGLEEITAGELLIDGRRMNDVSAAERGLAMVFQSYALYPHMTAAENMSFSLKLAGLPKEAIAAQVRQAADVLQITHLLDRKPAALSGGQRQRVAIGRAIVRKPGVFLFDEPLSNLDASLRGQMRLELTRLHRELKTTMMYVTHDQAEAMTLADRIVVFNAGRIEQIGAPMELYRRPANRFVAGFLGSPRINFLEATLGSASAQDLTLLLAPGVPLTLPRQRWGELGLAAGEALTLGIRAENLGIDGGSGSGPGLPAQVELVEQLGDVSHVHVRSAWGAQLVLRACPELQLRMGDAVRLALPPEHCLLFDAQGRALEAL